MNRRQQFGSDTPKKKANSQPIKEIKKVEKEKSRNQIINLNNLQNKKEEEEKEGSNRFNSYSSIEIREEEYEKKGIKIQKVKTTNNIKLPKYSKINEKSNLSSNKNIPSPSTETVSKHNSIDNKENTNIEENKQDSKYLVSLISSLMIRNLNKHYFNLLKAYSFKLYKESTMNEELDKIKILKVTTENTLNVKNKTDSLIYLTDSNKISKIEEVNLNEVYVSLCIYNIISNQALFLRIKK